jgi:hypothetical protein
MENSNVFDLSDDIFTIRGELCVSFDVNQNWNIVSVPVLKSNMSKNELFPNSISSAFGFNQSSGYYKVDSLTNGKGYWLKFPYSQMITICGSPVEDNFIPVNEGWNIIGAFDQDIQVSSLTTNPPGILQSYFFGYNSGYYVADQIQKGKGYWIKVSQAGEIVLPSSNKIGRNNLESIEKVLANAGEIVISDNSSQIAKLYLVENNLDENFFELPPIPPSNVFDVRFSSGRFVENVNQSNTILIQAATYPIRVKSTKYSIKIEIDDFVKQEELLLSGNEIEISNPSIKTLKISALMIPEKTELYQNYPNPFNPKTRIRF